MKYEIFRTDAGEFFFHLKATNGKVILASEGYKEKRNALKAIKAIQKSSGAKIVCL